MWALVIAGADIITNEDDRSVLRVAVDIPRRDEDEIPW